MRHKVSEVPCRSGFLASSRNPRLTVSYHSAPETTDMRPGCLAWLSGLVVISDVRAAAGSPAVDSYSPLRCVRQSAVSGGAVWMPAPRSHDAPGPVSSRDVWNCGATGVGILLPTPSGWYYAVVIGGVSHLLSRRLRV